MWIGNLMGKEEAVTGYCFARIVIWFGKYSGCSQTRERGNSQGYFMRFQVSPRQLSSFVVGVRKMGLNDSD